MQSTKIALFFLTFALSATTSFSEIALQGEPGNIAPDQIAGVQSFQIRQVLPGNPEPQEVSPTDVRPGYATVRLTLEAPSTHLISARLFMPAMGHGSLPIQITSVHDLASATFDLSNCYFSMPGAWQIILDVEGQARPAIINVSVRR